MFNLLLSVYHFGRLLLWALFGPAFPGGMSWVREGITAILRAGRLSVWSRFHRTDCASNEIGSRVKAHHLLGRFGGFAMRALADGVGVLLPGLEFGCFCM